MKMECFWETAVWRLRKQNHEDEWSFKCLGEVDIEGGFSNGEKIFPLNRCKNVETHDWEKWIEWSIKLWVKVQWCNELSHYFDICIVCLIVPSIVDDIKVLINVTVIKYV